MAPSNPIVRRTLLLLVAILSPTICTDSLFAQSSRLPASSTFADESGQSWEAEMLELRGRVLRLEETIADQTPDTFSISRLPKVDADQTIHELSRPFHVAPTRQYPTMKIDGFLQFDSVWFGETAATRMAYGDIADSTAVRRARLAASGDIRPAIAYKVDLDFAASGHPSFRDMIVEFKESPLAGDLVVGFFKAPFQLDALTSSKDFTFAERAPFFTFAPFRQMGIGAHGTVAHEAATWSVSGFRNPTDGFAVAQADDGYGISARSTMLPWYDGDGPFLLHVGFDYGYFSPGGKTIEYDAKLSFFVDEEPGGSTTNIPPLVDTGTILANGVNLFDVELAGTFGPIHYQSELTYALVNQIGGPPLTFYGGYAQLGWFLTGETRPYNRKTGVFTTVKPRCDMTHGLGAWEIAIRGTYLNLDDENIQGGQLNSVEFVVNWYLYDNVSLKFDCVRGFITHPTEGEVELDICGARLQVIY